MDKRSDRQRDIAATQGSFRLVVTRTAAMHCLVLETKEAKTHARWDVCT